MSPRGKPTTSTERMRLKKLRDQGKAPPLKNCKACGKVLKPTSGSSKASREGLCWDCWKTSPTGKIERRRQNLVKDTWGVAYFSCKPGEEFKKFARAKQAISNAYVDRTMTRNGPVVAVWNDGTVTIHWNMAQSRASQITKENGDELIGEPSPEWFRAQVDESKSAWFTVNR
ncbi:predicted protein [Cyanophage PSS2]|nr:predicted protein [Cyanophage PSS2]